MISRIGLLVIQVGMLFCEQLVAVLSPVSNDSKITIGFPSRRALRAREHALGKLCCPKLFHDTVTV